MGAEYTRASTKKCPSAGVRAQEEQDADTLRLAGFWESDCGWRHKALKFPWPKADAVKLAAEAAAGGQDVAHRALRGRVVKASAEERERAHMEKAPMDRDPLKRWCEKHDRAFVNCGYYSACPEC